MKRSYLIFALLIAGNTAFAQNYTNTGSGVNKVDIKDDEEETSGPSRSDAVTKVVYASPYSMDYMTMDVQDNKLQFNNVPDISMTLHITDANGNELVNRRMTKRSAMADISRLKAGMHFVTIISDNSNTRKVFTLNRN